MLELAPAGGAARPGCIAGDAPRSPEDRPDSDHGCTQEPGYTLRYPPRSGRVSKNAGDSCEHERQHILKEMSSGNHLNIPVGLAYST